MMPIKIPMYNRLLEPEVRFKTEQVSATQAHGLALLFGEEYGPLYGPVASSSLVTWGCNVKSLHGKTIRHDRLREAFRPDPS